MFNPMFKWLSGVFQDVDGNPSAKRTAFFILLAMLCLCVCAALYMKVEVPALIYNGLVDLIKWLGAFIVGERTPAAIAAFSTPKSDVKHD